MAGDKEIDRIFKESIEIDKAEDEMYSDSTPYQMPKDLVNKAKRLEKIIDAKKKLGGNMSYKLTPPLPELVDINVRVFTIGYGGMKSFEELKEVLDDYGITTLIDIRSVPFSRKWKVTDLTWSKKDLEAFFGARYIHIPELGGKGYEKEQFREWKAKAQEKIMEIYKMAEPPHKIALMCAEKHWENCHRDYFAGAALRDLGKPVVNLGVR
jgi:hypothetical protein